MTTNSHTDCFHDNTKQARSICRKVRRAIDLAVDLGGKVTWADCSETPNVRQVSITSSEDRWYESKLTITWSSHGVDITRFPGSGKVEKVPSTHLESWVSTILR